MTFHSLVPVEFARGPLRSGHHATYHGQDGLSSDHAL